MSQESFGAKFRTWKNQYIDLVESETDKILSINGLDVSPQQKKLLQDKLINYKNVFCEIGSGSGGHLIELARRNPTGLYIGFELRFKRAFRTAEKAAKAGIQNLFMVRAAAQVMPKLFDSENLSGVYINFPDPWSKPKWKKNRILNPEFVTELCQLLKSDGFISYKTDHVEYFEETVSMLGEFAILKVQKLTRDLYSSEYIGANIASEFENLFISQGLKINFLEAHKFGKREPLAYNWAIEALAPSGAAATEMLQNASSVTHIILETVESNKVGSKESAVF